MTILSLLVLIISYYSFSKLSSFKSEDWQLKSLTANTQSEMIQLRELYYSLSLGDLEKPIQIIEEIKFRNKAVNLNVNKIKALLSKDSFYEKSFEKLHAIEKNLTKIEGQNKKMSISYLSGYISNAKIANQKASSFSKSVLTDLSFIDSRINEISNKSLKATLSSNIVSGLSTLLFLFLIFPLIRYLKIAKELADQANKEKSQFLANMSHEIRTPLNGIIGMIDIIKQEQVDKTQESKLKIIEKSSTHLLNLINNILEISKIEAGKISLESIHFDFHHSVENACSIISTSAQKKNLDFNLFISKTVPQYILGDGAKLNQVLVNILNNAVKYTPAGKISLDIHSASDVIIFQIQDSGVGIPEDKIANIFDAFIQTDDSDTRKYGGTGLGLTISKEIVELMGGEISVESKEAVGSKFTLKIPISLSQLKERTRPVSDYKKNYSNFSKAHLTEYKNQEAHQNNENESSMGYRILLVEDNLINQKVASMMLKSKGHSVVISENGALAVERFRKEKFDLILMGCQMPVMDGYEATRRIRKIEIDNEMRATPIIAMTANAFKKAKEECFESGMDEFVTKPVRIESLIEIIDKTQSKKKSAA